MHIKYVKYDSHSLAHVNSMKTYNKSDVEKGNLFKADNSIVSEDWRNVMILSEFEDEEVTTIEHKMITFLIIHLMEIKRIDAYRFFHILRYKKIDLF